MQQYQVFDDFRDYQHRQERLARAFAMFEDYCKAVLTDTGKAGITMQITSREPGRSFDVDYLGRTLSVQWIAVLNEHNDPAGRLIFKSPDLTDPAKPGFIESCVFTYSGSSDFDAGYGPLAMTADTQAPLILLEVFKRFLRADPFDGSAV